MSSVPIRIAFATLVVAGTAAFMVAPHQTGDIPAPGDFFGRRVGTPGVLIRHGEILEYYEVLAERSDRIQLHHVGETTDGLPFYYALVSSPENLARIDELLADNGKLYDPRGVAESEAERIIRDGRTFVIVNQQIHSTEVGVSQAGILLAHRLAASDDDETRHILDQVVIAHVPVHNPDGQEMVARWLDEQRGTPYENSRPPFLYQRYVGHDNNRDWYMFTQRETRLSILMQNHFRPQFTLDQHQQGTTGSRMFVPPFEDPWEPNVDPALIASNNMIGTFMGQYLTARGYRGVEWKQRYDAWTPARAYYHTHGGVRILTEVASANFADDVEVPAELISANYRDRHWYFPMPWPGGTWTFGEVVDYSYAGAMAALRAAADLRPHLLRGMWEAQRRSVAPPAGSPHAFVIPAEQVDHSVAARLVEVLRLADVEVERADRDFTADGRRFGAGSIVVPVAQPAGRFAKSVLERQSYPQMYLYEGGPIDPPYDVTAHTLPLMMNVAVETIAEPFEASTTPLDGSLPVAGGVREPAAGDAAAYLMDPRVNNTFTVAAKLAGSGLSRTAEAFAAAGTHWPPGTWIYEIPSGAASIAARQSLSEAAAAAGVVAQGVVALPDVARGWVPAPRIALYQSYTASMPEGWTRFVLEDHGIPYETLHDAEIRAGDLAPYGLVMLPPGTADSIVDGLSEEPGERFGMASPGSPPRYAGGIGEEGLAALRTYVAEGGTVFTWAGSTGLASRYFDGPDDLGGEVSRTELNIPGSLLRVQVDTSHWLGYGLAEETPVFFWNSPFWSADGSAAVVARYPGGGLLLSGWIQGEDYLAGNAALLELPYGDGRIVMVGFSPEYRAQTHQTFKVLFNAAFRPRPDPAQ